MKIKQILAVLDTIQNNDNEYEQETKTAPSKSQALINSVFFNLSEMKWHTLNYPKKSIKEFWDKLDDVIYKFLE